MEDVIKQEERQKHSVNYQKGRLSITGVTEVKSSDDKCIVLAIDNKTLTIKGENLVITELLLAGGSFGVSGELISLTYSAGRQNLSLAKRLFK